MRPIPHVILDHGRGSSIFCFLIEPNVTFLIEPNVTLYFRSSIMLYTIERNNPFHVGLAELFHDIRVKLVIEIFNKIGSCLSYDEL